MERTDLDGKIKEMAERIRELREIEGLTTEEMAEKTGVSREEYEVCEQGGSDLNFTFIYRCAKAFGVNVTDIIEGYSPMLNSYTVTRGGEGQKNYRPVSLMIIDGKILAERCNYSCL